MAIGNMAVIGSTLSLPRLSDISGFNMIPVILVLALVGGLGWLMVDYALILALHRKMVSLS